MENLNNNISSNISLKRKNDNDDYDDVNKKRISEVINTQESPSSPDKESPSSLVNESPSCEGKPKKNVPDMKTFYQLHRFITYPYFHTAAPSPLFENSENPDEKSDVDDVFKLTEHIIGETNACEFPFVAVCWFLANDTRIVDHVNSTMGKYKDDLFMFKTPNEIGGHFSQVAYAWPDCNLCFVVFRRMTDTEFRRAVSGRRMVFGPDETKTMCEMLESKNIGYRFEPVVRKARQYLYICRDSESDDDTESDDEDVLFDGDLKYRKTFTIESDFDLIDDDEANKQFFGSKYHPLNQWCRKFIEQKKSMTFDDKSFSTIISFSCICVVVDECSSNGKEDDVKLDYFTLNK